ncbi:transketolase [Negativicoccus succinicivorans]|uniref:Transketolase n=1 Tax=Negativicoccus succinicivorans TaxID=620903 RepID=A0A841R3G5_9FIRM|nr:transketolase [Negativicoccus succinicivorans]MBB6477132.1 transketolase [Negativicoccus succinicivorans]MDU1055931.1 transketolase [Negativicoccus succinicivorans]MDU5232785.1 transketolase [Negativicoccus succinicivorans]
MTALTDKQFKEVTTFARQMRRDILKMVTDAKSGHPGGSLSITDLLALLYNVEMNIDPMDSHRPNRDRLVLSKGHAAPGLYAALAGRGFFAKEELWHLRKIDAMLQGHPDMKHTPGVEMTTGSLGQGFSAACGMALNAKLENDLYHTFVIVGDGESQEGQVWEAAMFAGHYKLDTLTAFIDFNGLQIDGKITDVMSPLPLPDKFRAFNWHTIEVDGHDINALHEAITEARETKTMPTAIIMKTVKGKGICEMENQAGWHGKAPSLEEYNLYIKELEDE